MFDTKKIEHIMGSYFESLSNFFKKINEEYSQKYDKIILLTRRCVILNEIFGEAFKYKVSENCDIVSDTNICMENFCGKESILIVDDIIIHGRAVTNLYNKLKKSVRNIDVSAYYMYYNAKLSNDINVLDYTMVTSAEWHDLSNKLVELILNSRIPYATFTASYYLEELSHVPLPLKNCYSTEIRGDSGKNIMLNVYFDNNCDFTLLKNINSIACVREYSYEDGTKTIIPFVIIPEIRIHFLELFSKLDLINDILDESNNIFIKSANYEYKSVLFSFMINVFYSKVILKNFDVKNFSLNWQVLLRTFPKDVMDRILNIDNEIARKFLNLNIVYDNNKKNIESDYLYKFDFNIPNVIENMDIAKDYACFWIYNLHCENEKRAITGEDRLYGYSVKKLLSFVNKSQLEKIITALIYVWDIGYGSYSFKKIEDTIYSCISDGEQAYKIMFMKYQEFVPVISLMQKYSYLSKKTNNYWDNWEEYAKSDNVNESVINNFKKAIDVFKERSMFDFCIFHTEQASINHGIKDAVEKYLVDLISKGNGVKWK